ncbi:MAG TPA: LamG-like jellyroll fold domain-containing protein, partial [Sedimentisphaerales bacterium]|nr:LamG-like jellyroll fold domain-containing protein [Sedimentisphaerales bacterium]
MSSKGHGGLAFVSSITNCIIWANSPDQVYYISELDYSCIQGGSSGTGNISDDPCFVDAGSNDYHLLSDSPCIDTGDPGYVPTAGETDIDGEPRVMAGHVDMGADEFTSMLVPIIGISPTEFEFYGTWGAANPETQILTIRNIGADTLNWEIIENCSWLEVYPNNGQSSGGPNEVTISVDISGLDCGTYGCNLTIQDPCAFNSPQIIPVYLHITGPVIELSAMHFEFTAIEGGADPQDQILTIRNSGSSVLNWTITEDCGWLSVEPNMGSSTGEGDNVTLSADILGLGPGIYNCELPVSDPNAENNPQTVTVILRLGDSDSQLHVPLEYTTIQEAIDAAWGGDTVIVAEGTYTGTGNKNLDFLGKAITVRSTDPEDPCVVAATVIDCEQSGRGFVFQSNEDADSILTGLTITNGRIAGTYAIPDAHGGGIYCIGASPTIAHCSIVNCTAYGWNVYGCCPPAGAGAGGGISCVGGSQALIMNCIISGNLARSPDSIIGAEDAYGGGIFCSSDSNINIYNCIITDNTSYGGRVDSEVSFWHIPLGSYGGGIYISNSSTIKNCLIADNETVSVKGTDYDDNVIYGKSRGAGIYCAGNVVVDNCTVEGNYTEPAGIRGEGGGIYGPAIITDCIVWGNLSTSQLQAATSVSYSDIHGGYAGTGNINLNPLFVSGPLGGYYLSQVAAGQASNSSCVDSGSDTAANLGMDIFTTRTDHIRDTGVVDMGYHYPLAVRSADIVKNWYVDFMDFAVLAGEWLQSGEPESLAGDIFVDGRVDIDDLDLLTDAWLDCYVTAADNPSPGHTAVGVDPNTTLSWAAGEGALYHDVYLGTDANAVAAADYLSPEFKDTVSEPNFDPCGLEVETLYYWRVDEVGPACTKKGNAWNFKTWDLLPSEPGLVSWWKFDEGQGDIAYDSEGNNDGIIYGAQWTGGQIGEALSFNDDGDDHVEIGDKFNSLNCPFTISAWINTPNAEDWHMIFESDKRDGPGNYFGFWLIIVNDGTVQIMYADGTANNSTARRAKTSSTTVPDNTWVFVAAVVRGATDMDIYINATDAGGYYSGTGGDMVHNTNKAIIGSAFDGAIDDVRLYNRALSAQEVRRL